MRRLRSRRRRTAYIVQTVATPIKATLAVNAIGERTIIATTDMNKMRPVGIRRLDILPPVRTYAQSVLDCCELYGPTRLEQEESVVKSMERKDAESESYPASNALWILRS